MTCPQIVREFGGDHKKDRALFPAMRIVGGSHGGRVLRAPAGAATRPTSEKVREAVFNILGRLLGPLDGIHVLDVFAGSGGLGIEALSRGAAHVTFVDAAKPAPAAVKGNLRELGPQAQAPVGHGPRRAPGWPRPPRGGSRSSPSPIDPISRPAPCSRSRAPTWRPARWS